QPPAPVRPKKSGAWKIVLLVTAIVVLIGGGLIAVGLVSSLSSFTGFQTPYTQTVGPRLEEVLVEDNDASAKIAVVEVEGIITSQMLDPAGFNMADIIKAQLKRAGQDAKVRAVVLKVDSPGGEVLASDQINKAIAEFQRKTGKPVVASMGNLAASGGYYVAVASRWIVANELTLTGSIGVIMSSWNYRGLMDKVGVRPFTYKSGKFKDMLSGTRDPNQIPDEEREILQGLIDDVYRQFKGVVADGRQEAGRRNEEAGKALCADWEQYADGRVFSGREAFKHGFVDELGDFATATARARKLANLSNANVVRYQRRIDFADLFRFFGESESRAVKLDLGIELPRLKAGQPYFLPSTHLP
ncbi:MAG TPA: signal peptide peptidase SppA, partial [Verrucomicrobiae bacterium]